MNLIHVSREDASLTLTCLGCAMPVNLRHLPRQVIGPAQVTFDSDYVGWVASLHLRFGCTGSRP